jgi:hypothetical protein
LGSVIRPFFLRYRLTYIEYYAAQALPCQNTQMPTAKTHSKAQHALKIMRFLLVAQFEFLQLSTAMK